MKNIFVTVIATLLFLAAGKLSSQKLMSVLQEDWNGNSWTNNSILSYSYNASQQVTLTLFQGWDGFTNTWKAGSRTSSTVDVDGNPTTTIQESWDNGSNSWTPTALIGMTYTLTNKLLTRVASIWTANAWQNSTMLIQKYDGSGALTETKYDSWNTGNASWQKFSIMNYTNNANGDPLTMQYSNWNSNNTWDNNSVMSFTYNPNNKISKSLYQIWVNNTWQNSYTTDYSYNTDEQLISTLGKKWDLQNLVFVNNSREDHTYLPTGKSFQSTQLFWDISNSSWNFMTRRTYNYDFIPSAITEINEVDLLVFPNPATSQMIISTSLPADELLITDTDGRTIKKIKVNSGENTIDITQLPNGIYILSGAGTSQRIIKE